jgi:hypothetical protein
MSSLQESVSLFHATMMDLDADFENAAFEKMMSYITDKDSYREFMRVFEQNSCWMADWLFSHRKQAMLVCDKCDEFDG